MWNYEKRLQYPVKIKRPDAKAAGIIVAQLGGPDGELGASMRYLNQRYSMPYDAVKGALTDIGFRSIAVRFTCLKACKREALHFIGSNFRKISK